MRGHGLASGARRVATLTRPHARPPRPTAGRRRPPWPLPAPSPFPETRTLAGPPAALPAACQPSGCPPWLDCCSHEISPGFLWPLMRAALPPGRAQSSFSRATMTACELVVRCQVLSDTVRPRNWTLDGPEPLRRPFEAPACSWLVRGSANDAVVLFRRDGRRAPRRRHFQPISPPLTVTEGRADDDR